MNAPKIENEGETVEESMVIDVTADKVALYNPIEAGLIGMQEKYKDGPKDLSVPAHYEECRLALADTRGIRSKTEKLRKELKADALAYGRLVDSTAKRIIDKVLEIEEPFAVAKKEFDTRIEIEKREKALAEELRVDGIASRIAEIGSMPSRNISSSSSDIEHLYPALNDDLDTCNEWAMEFSDKARDVITDTLAKLEELHTMKRQHELAAAEKARLEKEAAVKEEAARIQREKEAQEERARLAKEREAIDAERAAMQAERNKLAAEQEERNRLAAEERAEMERAARAKQEIVDRAAAEERERMAAEIEALKKSQEQQQAPAPAPAPAPSPSPSVTAPESKGYAQDYKDSGNAILAITGNKQTARALLDAIINGAIPNIQFTGAVK
jgi:hypothetical protein